MPKELVQSHWVRFTAYSTVLAWNTKTYAGNPPCPRPLGDGVDADLLGNLADRADDRTVRAAVALLIAAEHEPRQNNLKKLLGSSRGVRGWLLMAANEKFR